MERVLIKPGIIDLRGYAEASKKLADRILTDKELAMILKEQGQLVYWEEIDNSNTYKKKTIPPKLRWEIWERDNFTCEMCGKRRYLSIDHIIPESKGGELIKSNLRTLCINCNSKKGKK